MSRRETDVLIIGSGLAGCAAALAAARRGALVTIVTKGETAEDSNTVWAQGASSSGATRIRPNAWLPTYTRQAPACANRRRWTF